MMRGRSHCSHDGHNSRDVSQPRREAVRQYSLSYMPFTCILFDMSPDEHLEPQLFPICFQESEEQNNKPLPIPPTLNEDCELLDSNDSIMGETVVSQTEAPQCSYHMLLPAYFPPSLPLSFPYWSGDKEENADHKTHEIIKPTAVHSKIPINIEELVGMSKLSIGDSWGELTSSSSSLDLVGGPKRQSAFQAKPSSKSHA